MDGESQPSLLDIDTLREVLRRLEATDVDELEIVHGSSRLYIRREPGKRSTAPQLGTESAEPPDSLPLAAPLTGVFYARPSPDAAPYVVPGATVVPGQVVALIETMKLFNEVTAETPGEVVSIVVQQGDLVEAGQPLMYVRPHEEEQ